MIRHKLYEIIEISNQDSKISRIYDRFMMVTIVVSLLPLFFKESYFLFDVIDTVTCVIFIIDFILRWITSDLKDPKHNKLAFVKYPFTFWAVVDLLAILPSITILDSSFRLFKLFRLWKALKAIRILKYSKSFNLILTVLRNERQALLAVGNLIVGYIILSALVMFSAEPERFDDFFDAVYWSVITLTTVGYGDIYPETTLGRIVCMLSALMGIAIVALPTGIITAGYTNALNESQRSDKNKTSDEN